MKQFLLSFLGVFVLSVFLIWLLDPSITTFWDAVWFGFMIVTTIGFGDYTVVHPAARLVTVVLGLYGVLAIAFICGAGASWLFEKVRAGHHESVAQMLWQLEHLEQLDEENLRRIERKAGDYARGSEPSEIEGKQKKE